jgi:hypothetical protein
MPIDSLPIVLCECSLLGFKPHSLCHMVAARRIESGVGVLTFSKHLSHSDICTGMIQANVDVGALWGSYRVARCDG